MDLEEADWTTDLELPLEPTEPVGLAKRPNRRSGPWDYVLPSDFGVREDASGSGHFRAPRAHGEHNGIDLLAPVGTPVLSACRGQATSGESASFGNWVRLVCRVPDSLSPSRQLYASVFYAHLDEARIRRGLWARVRPGQKLGSVGKTGNARGDSVRPHVHLEVIIQDTLDAALDEQHHGRDQSMPERVKLFFDSLDARCLSPNGFRPYSGRVQRGRRADPFLVITCLASDKPHYQHAPAPLSQASRPWSELYSARAFDVNRGPNAFLLKGG